MRLTLALACSLLLAASSGAPDGHSSAGTGETRQALRGASQLAPRPIGRVMGSVSEVGSDAPYPADPRLSVSGAPPTAGGLLSAPSALARRISGTATWCAPTPRYCKRWGGKAMLAAVPSFRYGDEPYTVQVTGFHGGKANAVLVTVVSYCDCGRTVIDLSPHAFAQLAPLSVGRIRVVVDGVKAGRSIPLAPPTDTDGG